MVKKHKEEAEDNGLFEVKEKAKLADEYLEQLQRLQAEFENYRKRVVKEKEDFRKYVLNGFLYELLSVVDNIQRAVSLNAEQSNYGALREGVGLVEKQLTELLKTQDVSKMDTKKGDTFDPHLHHAVSHEPSEEYPPDTVTQIMQEGYQISGRVLRPAMVVVSSGKSNGLFQEQDLTENTTAEESKTD